MHLRLKLSNGRGILLVGSTGSRLARFIMRCSSVMFVSKLLPCRSMRCAPPAFASTTTYA
eukprot:2646682-Pleurochrysis_carterae.AAC.1